MPRIDVRDQHVDAAIEAALLNTLKADPSLYWTVADRLAPEFFTGERAAEFAGLKDLADHAHAPAAAPDPATLKALGDQAAALLALYQKRETGGLLQESFERLAAGGKAEDVLARLADGTARLQNVIREDQAGRMVSASGLIGELLADLEKRRAAVKEHGAAAVGIPTGIRRLDTLLGGLQTGLHLLAAEPGAGKTTLALQIAGRAAADGCPVLFISFEETLTRLTLKAICQKAGLESKRFADGWEDPGKVAAAAREHEEGLRRLFLMEGTSKLTMTAVKARALRLMGEWQADRCLVVVDYLQRWASIRRESTEFRLLVNLMVAELRELAMRLDSPILAIASQNRAGQGKAEMTSLKESADLEYSADSILFLTEPGGGGGSSVARTLELAVRKNRFGDQGTMKLVFKPAVGTFAEMER